jgi:glutamyl-tRNA synthetase
MSAEEVYSHVLNWARNYGREAIEQALSDKEYALAVFGIERGGAKPRKDLVTWVDVPDKLGFFFDELYAGMIDSSAISRFDHEVIAGVVDPVISKYSVELSLEDWQKLMLEVASDNGFATDNKLYKANPETYKGSRADIFTIIRTLIAGRNISPDLYSVMKVMGKDRLSKRLEKSLAQLEPAGQ